MSLPHEVRRIKLAGTVPLPAGHRVVARLYESLRFKEGWSLQKEWGPCDVVSLEDLETGVTYTNTRVAEVDELSGPTGNLAAEVRAGEQFSGRVERCVVVGAADGAATFVDIVVDAGVGAYR